MHIVTDLLRTKGHQVYTITPTATVFEALELMAARDIGALVVLDANGELAGIFSERDHARKVDLLGRSAREVRVGEIMSAPVICVTPGDTVEACMNLMTNHRIRHLPVREKEQLVGLISIGDVVKAIITKQQFLIDQLENYITGQR
jgi:CBS domain-containing protein